MSEQKRIDGLDFLRGIASLAVCWLHLTKFNYPSANGHLYEFVTASGRYGWLGVEVFFVISGFIIPYSLHRAGYRLKAYPTFIAKRILRLDPPYLVSIVLILLLAYAYALHRGHAVDVEGAPVDLKRILLHLGYLNIFFGYLWFNPNFWTLAIEFQYYLLIGLAFPLISSRRRSLRIAALACFAVPGIFAGPTLITGGFPYSAFIFRFAFLFAMGIVTFQWRAGLTGGREYALLLTVATAGALITVGLPSTGAGLLAVGVINFYNRRTFISQFFGNISYSLYLLHWPVGHLTLSLIGARMIGATSDLTKVLMLLAALGTCSAAAYALYLFVEKPAQRWSARIEYVPESRRLSTTDLAVASAVTPKVSL